MGHLIAAEQIVSHCGRAAQCSQGLEEIAQNKQLVGCVSVCWERELYPLQRSFSSFFSPSYWSLLFPCISGPGEVGRRRGGFPGSLRWWCVWFIMARSHLQLWAMPSLPTRAGVRLGALQGGYKRVSSSRCDPPRPSSQAAKYKERLQKIMMMIEGPDEVINLTFSRV